MAAGNEKKSFSSPLKIIKMALDPEVSGEHTRHAYYICAVLGCLVASIIFVVGLIGANEPQPSPPTLSQDPIQIMDDGRIKFNFAGGSIDVQGADGKFTQLAEFPAPVELEENKKYYLHLGKNLSESKLIAVAKSLHDIPLIVTVDVNHGSLGLTDDVLWELSKVPQLVDIRATYAPLITNEGLEALTHCKNLESLSMHNNVKITDVGVEKFVHSKTTVQNLGLSGTKNVTQGCLDRLHDEYHKKVHNVRILDDRIKCPCQTSK